MPNKIDTGSIVRDLENERQNDVQESNADYVTQLEKTSSIMPPEKPFETEAAQDKVKVEESQQNNQEEFVQQSKTYTNEIERLDKTNETKLHLLNSEHSKIANKLGQGALSKTEQASLKSLIQEVEQKIETYRSKLKAGSMSGGGVLDLDNETDSEENNGEGGSTVMDELKDQVLMAAPGLLGKKKEEEEEEKEGEIEKEVD